MSRMPACKPVRACIFDVDGLLINSEDIYHDIYNQILADHGKPPLPYSVKALQASRGDPGLSHILKSTNLPLTIPQFRHLCTPLLPQLSLSTPLPGAQTLLSTLSSSHPDIHLAIASSSSRTLFKTKTSHLPFMTTAVTAENSVFGDDEGMKGKGKKPAPDVFLAALAQLNAAIAAKASTKAERKGEGRGESGDETNEEGMGMGMGRVREEAITPSECLVFEDSIAGVEAARRAGMRVVWVPSPNLLELCQGWVDDVLAGTMLQEADRVGEVRPRRAGEVVPPMTTRGGVVRRSNDGGGWATCIDSLENFDYALLN